MNKNASRLLGGVAAAIVAGAGVLAVSGMALGLENRSLVTTPAPHAETTRVLVAQAEGAKVSFTTEQADSGKKVFNEDCVECHGKDLRGGLLGGPPLRGQAFDAKYAKGAPAGTLYEVMSGTMPPNAPGSYSPETYADLMAYILKTSGYKAGSAELPADVDALYNLIIEK
jgi:mono/diheme cytochrome c family protein